MHSWRNSRSFCQRTAERWGDSTRFGNPNLHLEKDMLVVILQWRVVLCLNSFKVIFSTFFSYLDIPRFSHPHSLQPYRHLRRSHGVPWIRKDKQYWQLCNWVTLPENLSTSHAKVSNIGLGRHSAVPGHTRVLGIKAFKNKKEGLHGRLRTVTLYQSIKITLIVDEENAPVII